MGRGNKKRTRRKREYARLKLSKNVEERIRETNEKRMRWYRKERDFKIDEKKQEQGRFHFVPITFSFADN